MSSKEYYSPQLSSRFANPSFQASKTLLHEDHHEDKSVNGSLESDLPLDELNDKSNKPNRSRSQSFSFSPSSPHLFKLRLDPSKPMLENEFDIDTEKGNYGSRWTFEKKAFSTEVESSDEGEDLEEQKRQLETITQIKKDVPVRTEGRLLIVANRLPLSMKVVKKPPTHEGGKERKELTFSSSSGGLVSALGGCDIESRWIGWPGAEVKRSVDKQSVMHKLEEQNCVPVFLSQSLADAFYNGFCNNILWPLFHYIPLDVDSISKADEQFEAYQVANQNFSDVLLNTYQEGDVVWVHDYHCLLMPRLLRQRYPNMKIGFFFHTPFPAFEVLRVMPSREELLAGVLSADLIGFHTADYMHNFSNACARILGATINGDEITYQKFTARVGAFPIGIDPKRFIQTIESNSIEQYMEEYKKEFQGKKVLLGIDRLDYIKGIQHKIYALERLFEKYPEMAKEVVLVQIAVPSRTDVLEYQKLKSATHKLVGRVNGTYGSVSSSPIHYLDQSIPFEKMCALYRVADVLVVTSIRDGMNLVCYEYIACQKDMAGALVLSEFAGAAQCLSKKKQDNTEHLTREYDLPLQRLTGPLIVNPWSVASVSEAMRLALTMPEEERRERNAQMFEQVSQNTSSHWARRFLSALLQATKTSTSWLPGLQSIGNDVAHQEEIHDAAVQEPAAAVVPDKASPRDSPARSMLPSALR